MAPPRSLPGGVRGGCQPGNLTAADILGAVSDSTGYAAPAHDKPRASGIGHCARQQWYWMSETPTTDEHSIDTAFTLEQGRVTEDITIKALRRLGYRVTGRQKTLPDTFFVVGHPDGQLSKTVGFEHKHLGRYQYERVLGVGLFEASPEYVAQVVCYGAGLGWEQCLFTITSQDASSIRWDRTSAVVYRKGVVKPWMIAEDYATSGCVKMYVCLVDLQPLYDSLLPVLQQRAADLVALTATPEREYDGERSFPCGYCDWQSQCRADGEGGVRVKELPW